MGKISPSRSHQLGTFLDGLSFNRRHWLVALMCGAGLLFDALNFQVMALVAPSLLQEWQLSPRVLGSVLSATVVGMLLGTYVFAAIADRIGRRVGFQVTVALFAVFGGLCGLAQNLNQLMLLRFFAGLGIGGFLPIDTAVLAEFTPSKSRGRVMAFAALCFPLGGLLAAWVASVFVPSLGWRALFFVGVLPAIIIFFVRWYVPETPRFLLQKGRFAEAEKSAAWIAMGKLPSLANAIVNPSSPVADQHNRPRIVRELFSKTYRRRTMLVWAIWFTTSFSYYGMIMWLPTLLTGYKGISGAQVYPFIIGYMGSGIAGRIVVSLLIDRIGRKPLIAIYAICAACGLLIFGQQNTLHMLMLYGYITAFFHDGCFSAIIPYTPELYPTRMRATGVGWASGAGRIAAIIAPIAIGFMVTANVYSVFILLAVNSFAAGIVVLAMGIETKGMVLEDASLEMDGNVANGSGIVGV